MTPPPFMKNVIKMVVHEVLNATGLVARGGKEGSAADCRPEIPRDEVRHSHTKRRRRDMTDMETNRDRLDALESRSRSDHGPRKRRGRTEDSDDSQSTDRWRPKRKRHAELERNRRRENKRPARDVSRPPSRHRETRPDRGTEQLSSVKAGRGARK